ncbi:MAG: UDP-N-acetylglucosamine 2-epimerase (non-hydrolyzing) [Candidatus Omnitrophica bacterium]|nr:UDP-N-acetylglucosamine 2-epimerase (non-hydrolyzing) [Candidatus Omnitrophota bacterium]
MGTRPEAIKMAPVVVACRQQAQRCRTQVVATAQHRQMLDQVLQVFDITPDVDLDLMEEGQGLGALTARLLTSVEALWRRERPALVLVQGDTTSSFSAALAAYYLKIPIGHIEAGLRSGDKYAPFPEEMNRRLIDAMADFLFAPTESSKRNLLAEGAPASRITVTGNTGIDALFWTLARLREPGARLFPSRMPTVSNGQKLILVTAHRRENFGGGLSRICEALETIGRRRPDAVIVYAVHPNPNVQGPVHQRLGRVPNIRLIPPLDYPRFVHAMSQADVILTDSGGIQEEVASLGKPILVMREVTERTEAIDLGIAELVGTDTERIVARTLALLDRPARAAGANPFGDGHAGARIVETLLERL